MAYSIEILKSLIAQCIENSNVDTEVNTSCEMIWPVNNTEEMITV